MLQQFKYIQKTVKVIIFKFFKCISIVEAMLFIRLEINYKYIYQDSNKKIKNKIKMCLATSYTTLLIPLINNNFKCFRIFA